MSFVHLHVHSQFSLLDSTIKIPDLVKEVKALGMSAVALTDRCNMFGSNQFRKVCDTEKIKAIYGAQIFVRNLTNEGWSNLVILARNDQGFANLRTLVSRAYTEGLVGAMPLISRKLLTEHAGGLIGLSGCLGGEIPQAIMREDRELSVDVALDFASIFEEGQFYLELEGNELVEQDNVNRALYELGQEISLPVVGTNNVHYLKREDAPAHAVLVAIQAKRNLTPQHLENLALDSFHLSSPEEMVERFSAYPEAVENTVKIADSIEVNLFKKANDHHFPVYDTPDGEDTSTHLRALAHGKLEERFGQEYGMALGFTREKYLERLEYELDVICKLGFAAYYLIVRDFIDWSRKNGIPVGPGRGSGAGSLVAYAIGITDIDPLRYDLLFERFLNPERVNPPDFDIDFCTKRREEVIDYVTEKYGREKVGQIITYSTMKARAAIKDVARALGIPVQQADSLTKLIPQVADIVLSKAYEMEPRLRQAIDDNPDYKVLWKIAQKLEGLNRQPSMHAAGVVIADLPIEEYAPLFVTDEGAVVTQYNMGDLDDVGLIKFDFLGLTSLTIIDHALDIIRERGNPDFKIEEIPIDDAETFEMLSHGHTAGVFQLETSGITTLVQRMKPDRIEDIIATIALFRPGPLQSKMDDEYIAVKHKRKQAEYPIAQLKPILEDTYGTILYQEQVMLIASRLGGFSMGGADLLRRAMGKKKPEELAKLRAPFLEGCAKNGIDLQLAVVLFEKLEKFAEYGFNKSHSAAYAVVAYQMAYLKAHYKTEFLCAVLTQGGDDKGKVLRFTREARDMGIPVFGPDVNMSGSDFTVEDYTDDSGQTKQAIRFGMGAVKGIGESAIEAIIIARKDGNFESVTDFLLRVELSKVNRRAIEALIKCGALDGSKHTRASMMSGLDTLISRSVSLKAEKDSGQTSLFDSLLGSGGAPASDDGPPPLPEWPKRQLLAFEKEAVGYYISAHPLDDYQSQISRFATIAISELPAEESGDEVVIAGMIASQERKISKKTGAPFAVLDVEDVSGQIECIVTGRAFPTFDEMVGKDGPVLVRGKFVKEGDDGTTLKIIVGDVQSLETARIAMINAVRISIDMSEFESASIDEIGNILKKYPGSCDVEIALTKMGLGTMVLQADSSWKVSPVDDLLNKLTVIVGRGKVRLT